MMERFLGHNRLFWQCCPPHRLCFSLADGSPYEREGHGVRQEYVAQCVSIAREIFDQCHFMQALIVVYEDKYAMAQKGEEQFIEQCLQITDKRQEDFYWHLDDEEIYKGKRTVWQTKSIDVEQLFAKIILSEIGENTELDSAVYIMDRDMNTVFFLYDDRGIDVYLKNVLNKEDLPNCIT